MFKYIHTPIQVTAFASMLIKEGTNFHPDTDFNDYVNLDTQVPAYSKEEAALRNELMGQCFTVCHQNGIDIYDFMAETALKETGLDKFIPLPSAEYTA